MGKPPTEELLPFVFVITVKVRDGDHRNAEMEQMLFETQLFFDCLLKRPPFKSRQVVFQRSGLIRS